MQMGRLSSSSISSYKPTRIITTNLNHNQNRSSSGSIQCKKHPKHRQSPGVCSLCLSEKLTKVSNNTTTSSSSSSYTRARATYYCSSSSLSSSEEESYASSASSTPPQHPNHHRRIASDVMLRLDASSAGRGFGKSRSMAAAQQKDGGRLRSDSDGIKNSKKVISGFWAKILRPRKNKKSREINVNVNVNGVDRKVLIKNVTQSQPLGASTSTSTAVY